MRVFMSDREEAERLLAVMSGIEALDYRTRILYRLLLVVLGVNIVFIILFVLATYKIL
jgi:hypothetical protein